MNDLRRFALASLLIAACGGGGSSHSADMTVCAGAPTTGAADTHCEGDGGLVFSDVDPNSCTASGSGTDPADYGDTMYGTSGYDDDCKYHVTYTVDPTCENEGVYYTAVVTYAKDGTPVTGAQTRIEAFLSDSHPAPTTGTVTESPSGTYKVGPVVFNAAGTWTVRFHFFESCDDVDGSPHGHAAFYMTVP